MKDNRFSRRNLLKAAGLGSTAAALLPELSNPAYADGAVPKMFLMFYSYHGTVKSRWGTGNGGLTLGSFLKPLEPYKNDIVLVSSLHMKSADLFPGDGNAAHIQGQVHSLTSAKHTKASANATPIAGGPSIDQEILSLLIAKNGGNPLTPVDSLQLAISDSGPGSDQMMGRAGYRRRAGAIVPFSPVYDPLFAHQRIFPPGMGGNPSEATQRKLMAKFSKGQFNEVSNKIKDLYGSSSQTRFQAHADYMSALEKSLAAVPGGTDAPPDVTVAASACESGKAVTYTNKTPDAKGWLSTLSDTMPKLAHLALSCGRTRFVTINIEATVDPDTGLHDKIHNNALNAEPFYVRTAEQVAKTLKLLKETPTADGKNMLYHTVFLWAGELGNGQSHKWDDVNWIVGGQAGGALQTGRFVEANGKTTADLFVSVGKLMDSGMTTFGDSRAFTGPIAAIKA
ncbi:MAG: DUF1552 domain-containing protein [Myxococcales bacterium]|nr:DUF1552 domain-containing protein [Myxococcales bacterium]